MSVLKTLLTRFLTVLSLVFTAAAAAEFVPDFPEPASLLTPETAALVVTMAVAEQFSCTSADKETIRDSRYQLHGPRAG